MAIRYIRGVLLRLILALSAATALGDSQSEGLRRVQASVVEARLVSVTDITGQVGAPCFCDDAGNVVFDGSFRLFFKPVRTLVGPRAQSVLSYDQASAKPIVGGRYIVVVSHRDGNNVVVWHGPRASGLCLSGYEIQQLRLERIAQTLPCRS